jgi:hypothetical protein
MPAESTHLGQLAGPASKRVIDLDKVELVQQGVEPGDGVAQRSGREAAESLGPSERGAGLRVDEPDAHHPISADANRHDAGDRMPSVRDDNLLAIAHSVEVAAQVVPELPDTDLQSAFPRQTE